MASPGLHLLIFSILKQTAMNMNGFMDFKIILTKWTNGLKMRPQVENNTKI